MITAAGLAPGGPAYDAALHALPLGFVFAVVFGHAPIVFPAVLRVSVPYHAVFYAPFVLLHAAPVLRVAGAAIGSQVLLRWGGLGSALALLAFVAMTVSDERRKPRWIPPPRSGEGLSARGRAGQRPRQGTVRQAAPAVGLLWRLSPHEGLVRDRPRMSRNPAAVAHGFPCP